MKLKLQTVTPAQGLQWVRAGVRELLHRPLAYMGLLMMFMLAMLLSALLPVIGSGLMLMAVPLLSLGFMMATRASLSGHVPGPGVYLAPWANSQAKFRRPLLVLCFCYALLSAGVMGLGYLFDGGALSALFEAMNDPKSTDEQIQELANAPGLFSGAVLRLGLTMLISLPFWHAPALVVWAGQSAAQAMFSSTLALWRARWAFMVYSLGWLGLTLTTASVATFLASLLGNNTLSSLLLIPVGVAITSAYYASQFFSFQDSFLVEVD